RLMETGANDVLVVKGDDRERLVPFIRDQIVRTIDLDAGTMEVDWDPEF
ncbi:MAG: ribosome maturation factor RimM, partial [Gammaproteobacteria bacterium]